MSTFVYEIANRYPDRIVIFDSPPLLLTSEAHVLASHMGQIALVVEAEGHDPARGQGIAAPAGRLQQRQPDLQQDARIPRHRNL